MEALKSALYVLKLKKISTVLQSGNVSFESVKTIEELKPIIEKKLGEVFAYDAFVQIYEAKTILEIIEQYPFTRDVELHDYVVLINDNAILKELSELSNEVSKEEKVQLVKNTLYWQVEKGHSLDSKFAKLITKPKYKQNSTVRKINTLEKITRV